MMHEQLTRFYSGFRRDAHPMAVMVGVVGALSAFYHNSIDIKDPAQREMASIRMIAKMPTIAAMAYKYSTRPAVHLSEKRAEILGEFSAYVLCRAGRGIQGRPRPRQRHEAVLYSSC